jgi:hypothetical protein
MMIWHEVASFVFGMGVFMMQMARMTLPMTRVFYRFFT